MTKKLVIIGGGIAGLSAGIFAQINGFDSVILEKNPILGGECTGWDCRGYHIDGCIHWLVGTKENTPMNKLWKTLGALDGVDVYHPETFLTFEHEQGTVHLYKDLERLKESWIEMSRDDKEVIEEFCSDIKKLHSFDIPTGKPMDLMTIVEKIKAMISMKEAGMIVNKYGKITLNEFANRFKHPALRDALGTFLPEGYNAMPIFFALATYTKGDASIPVGGSRTMSMNMEKRYVELGGVVETLCEVSDLKIDGKIVGQIETKDGRRFSGDYYLAACDARFVYENLLKGRYNDTKYETRFNDPVNYPLASNIYVSLGYEGSTEGIPRSVRFPLKKPITINDKELTHLMMTHYNYEPTFAPEGNTVITCAINQFHSDVDAWIKLANSTDQYKREKERIGDEVRQSIELRYPEMAGKIEVLDVATPITYEKYCNAYRGSFMGFLPTVKGKSLNHTGGIKGLDNLYLTGQWLQPPGGLPTAAITGKDTIMRICWKEKQNFRY